VNGIVLLGAITWRSVLRRLAAAADAAGEARSLSDIAQLDGLCQREDSEAFLPVTSEELTGSSGRRVMDFSNLVDDLTSRLVDAGHADVKGLRAAAGKGWYGKYMRLAGVPSLLHFNAGYWGGRDCTPLWLRVYGPNWRADESLTALLHSRAQAEGTTAVSVAQAVEIPIHVPTGVERGEVLADAFAQLLRVTTWLLDAGVAPGVEGTPLEEDLGEAAVELKTPV
jgi:hypothetical protein